MSSLGKSPGSSKLIHQLQTISRGFAVNDSKSVEDLYQDLIVDHFKHPRCKEVLQDSTSSASLLNPLCGDEIEIFLQVRDEWVERATFQGKGCSISQASASMMCELLQGKTIQQAYELIHSFAGMMKEEGTPEEFQKLGDAASLQGVKRFAARIKCAMLCWEAAKLSLDRCES